MNPFWSIDEATLARVRGEGPGAAAAQPDGPEAGAPFLRRIEQVLGEETEPDAEFFVDSWTVGVAAASKNLLDRKREQKSREQQMPRWNHFSRFAPFFVDREDASAEMARPYREPGAGKQPMAERRRSGDEELEDWQGADEAEAASSLTVESACRLLGVTATSTREQIRAAYRRMASRYHPDRLARAEAGEQKQAGDRMASINEAYRLLCAGLVGQWNSCFN